ncbi:MAG: hypothetical protein P4M15_09960 [Alphaproteobacteria bacterium]|nr:hypothetical protein [Alphaproteobacteria bacterium]
MYKQVALPPACFTRKFNDDLGEEAEFSRRLTGSLTRQRVWLVNAGFNGTGTMSVFKFLQRVSITALLALAPFAGMGARAEVVPIGVNIVNPGRLSEQRQSELLDQLVAAGVTTIRVPLASNAQRRGAVRFIEAAATRNLHILLIVDLEFPPDAPMRPADPRYPHLWSGHPLSAADAALFKESFGAQLAAFEAKGIRFAGFELGNEINWAAFNGEFPIPGEQKILSFDDLADDPEGRKIAAGFRNYVETLKALRELRDASQLNRQTPIITAGLASPGPAGPRPGSPADAVAIPDAFAYLQKLGVDRIADAIGVHAYTPVKPGMKPEDFAAALRKGPLSICGPKVHCWVTEWGLNNADTQCPVDDSGRAQEMTIARQGYNRLMATHAVTGLYYFAWNTSPWSKAIDPLSLYRCGRLTESGPIAISVNH